MFHINETIKYFERYIVVGVYHFLAQYSIIYKLIIYYLGSRKFIYHNISLKLV